MRNIGSIPDRAIRHSRIDPADTVSEEFALFSDEPIEEPMADADGVSRWGQSFNVLKFANPDLET